MSIAHKKENIKDHFAANFTCAVVVAVHRYHPAELPDFPHFMQSKSAYALNSQERSPNRKSHQATDTEVHWPCFVFKMVFVRNTYNAARVSRYCYVFLGFFFVVTIVNVQKIAKHFRA